MAKRRPQPQPPDAARPPELTSMQRWAQDETVAVLRRYADAAEGYLRRRAAILRARGVSLCPCGISDSDCQCPLRRADHHG